MLTAHSGRIGLASELTDPLPVTRLPSTQHEWCRYPCPAPPRTRRTVLVPAPRALNCSAEARSGSRFSSPGAWELTTNGGVFQPDFEDVADRDLYAEVHPGKRLFELREFVHMIR